MKLNQIYRITLFGCIMLLQFDATKAMDMKTMMQQGQQALTELSREVADLKTKVQNLQTGSAIDPEALQQAMAELNELKQSVAVLAHQTPSNGPATDQSAPSATINEQAKALKELNTTLERIGYGIVQAQRDAPGVNEYQPLYTTEAKPGIMGMVAETIRQERQAEFRAKTRQLFDWLTEDRTKVGWIQDVAYLGVLGITVPMITILAKKSIDTTLDVIKHKFTTSITILGPETKYGRLDRWKRWWSGYKTPAMIFDQSVKDRLEEIEKVTKNIREHIKQGTKKDVKYRNLLLYGKPGTGKTLFAQILADKTDMDFLSVSAGDLLQSGAEGKKYFDDLVEMANRSNYGTIIFIDEADGLFIDRDVLLRSKALDHLVVLNHILGATGSGSNKFMLIAATNNAHILDEAMESRFPDQVEMPLPNETTRLELLNLYIKDKFPKPEALLTPEKIQDIARQTAGLSHRHIKSLVDAMSTKADATKSGVLTQEIIDSAIMETIANMKKLEKNRLEREKALGLPQQKLQAEESAA